jgi:glycosyltransferase involved in cell wall biosynthesis
MLSFLNRLDPARIQSTLIVFNSEGPLRDLLSDRVSVVDLCCERLRQALVPMRRALAELKPDVAVSTMAYVNFALLGVSVTLPQKSRVIVREANSVAATHSAIGFPIASRWLYRLLYPRADRIICPSEAIAIELSSSIDGLAGLTHVLPNPVDTKTVRASAGDGKRHPGDGHRFVAAGRLTYQKGFDRLLEMLAQLREDCHITILGEGPERSRLVDRAKTLGVENCVTFAGFDANPWPWYAGADVFLLPSRWEGMPNAALEALACGTPVIACPEAGGIEEVAAKAVPESVTIAEIGHPFRAAMGATVARNTAGIRASLLPGEFEIDRAVARFQSLILGSA